MDIYERKLEAYLESEAKKAVKDASASQNNNNQQGPKTEKLVFEDPLSYWIRQVSTLDYIC